MRLRICALLLALGAAAVAVRAQEHAVPALTAGDIVLLSNSPADTVSAALRVALGDSNPAARIAAGRVAASLARGDLAEALVGALARERDPAVGAEFIRDLLHLFGARDLDIVEPQSKRLGGAAAAALAEWLARMDPDRFREHLAAFAADAEEVRQVARFVSIAAWQHPDQAAAVRRAWMAVAPEGTWEAVLRDAYARTDITPTDAPLFVDALHAPSPHVREETVWFLLQALAAKQNVTTAVLTAAGEPRADAGVWERFGRELIARGGEPARPDRHDLVQAEGAAHRANLSAIVGLPQLTSGERDAALKIVAGPRNPFADVDRPVASARTIGSIAPGILSATLRAADCVAPAATVIATAALSYAPDGMPQHITLDGSRLSPPCQRAWAALARTTAADAAEPISNEGQRVMLLLNDDVVACTDAADEPRSNGRPPAAVAAARVLQPHKIKDVRPEYPREAQGRGIQGVVVIQATITTHGCVSRARLLRSIPYLDAPAMAAVSGWKFEPTMLNGEPVPVIMTVTVNFSLR